MCLCVFGYVYVHMSVSPSHDMMIANELQLSQIYVRLGETDARKEQEIYPALEYFP